MIQIYTQGEYFMITNIRIALITDIDEKQSIYSTELLKIESKNNKKETTHEIAQSLIYGLAERVAYANKAFEQ